MSMRHFIYTDPANLESDWVYGGLIRDGEPVPFVWPGCMVAVFEDETGKPGWKQAFFEKDRRNRARRVLRVAEEKKRERIRRTR